MEVIISYLQILYTCPEIESEYFDPSTDYSINVMSWLTKITFLFLLFTDESRLVFNRILCNYAKTNNSC